MRRKLTILLSLIVIILLGCSKHAEHSYKDEEHSYKGLNGEILLIENQLITIKAKDSIILELNKKYFIDVSDCSIYYVDFDTQALCEINIENLSVGDHITMDVTKSKIEGNLITPEQIQLITQR